MKNIPPKIAVLLAAYNGQQWIEEQLESILCQEAVDVDIFISVDLSNDNTLTIVNELSQKYSNINILPYGEVFGGAAPNFYRLIRDVDVSVFDFISLSDQDDIWSPNKLSRSIAMLEEHQADVYSADVLAFWPDGREKYVKKSYPQKRFDGFFEAAGPGCTYVFRQQPFLTFKTFIVDRWDHVNTVILHDWLIHAWFRGSNKSWFIDNKPMMRYRQHGANQVGYNSGIRAYAKRFRLIKNHWYRQQAETIFSLVRPFTTQQIRFQRTFLLRHFWQLRRRPRDAVLLMLMILFGLF